MMGAERPGADRGNCADRRAVIKVAKGIDIPVPASAIHRRVLARGQDPGRRAATTGKRLIPNRRLPNSFKEAGESRLKVHPREADTDDYQRQTSNGPAALRGSNHAARHGWRSRSPT
jgi:hypothetical protein